MEHRRQTTHSWAPSLAMAACVVLALCFHGCSDKSGYVCQGEGCPDNQILGPTASIGDQEVNNEVNNEDVGVSAEGDAGDPPLTTNPPVEPDVGSDSNSPPQEEDVDEVEDVEEPANICGDERVAEKIYYGTEEPTYLPLTSGQILSVGNFYGCSGTLIAPRWVLSASHCSHRVGSQICFGSNPQNANICFSAINVYEPQADMSLLELDADVTLEIPGIMPIPIMTEEMDNSWVGRTAEASGYGQQETGASNEREFTAEPIVAVRGGSITIDGMGQRGVCFGDSGGPLMVIASDGTVRVAGVLSAGDSSCVGQDNFTRVDVLKDWIEERTGPTVVDGAGCGSVDQVGRCLAGQAVWCQDEALQTQTCEGIASCGWDDGEGGYRCVSGDNLCNGLDNVGVCDGEVALWCEEGEPRARDCGACSQACEFISELNGAYCVDDPCQGLDYFGQCDGDVVQYCDDGEYKERDCAAEGLGCVWYNNRVGYWCY